MATVVSKVGTEFLVNSITTSGQGAPRITNLHNGGFVVTWLDGGSGLGDTSPDSIRAQIFDAAGNTVGSEFLVNTQTANSQDYPAITVLNNGNFVVTFEDRSGALGDSSSLGVAAQIFDASGTKVGSEFLVNTQTASGQRQPTTTSLSNGGFVVTWIDSSGTLGDSSVESVKAQIFDASGTKVGSEFLVNTQTSGSQFYPEVTGLTNGNFVVTWWDTSGTLGDSSSSSVKAQIFNSSGTKVGSEFLVNTQTSSDQLYPTIASLKNGGFVVTWEDASHTLGDSSDLSIKAQIYNASGTKVGSEFLVNTTTANGQMDPKVVGLANGGFVVVWESASTTGGDPSETIEIKLQVYDATGTKIGSELSANSPTALYRGLPSVAAQDDGGFVVTWAGSDGTLGSHTDYNIKAQIFQVRIEGTSGNDTLNGGDYHDVIVSFGGNDTIDGGAGADNMAGGTGDDTYYVDNTGDVVTELTGEGNDTVYTSVNYALTAGSEVETLRANAGATGLTLTGNEFNNTIVGGSGVDTMAGGTGNDTYYVDNTGDVVTELTGGGNDTVYASVSYTLSAGSEVETLRANAGATELTLTGNEFNNTIVGGSGGDTLNGGGGNDTLDGGAGADAMAGGTDDDTYYVDNTGDTVTESTGQGNDTIYASVNYTLAAGSEVETLRANAGSTGLALTGNEFNNTIVGGAGVDTLAGGTGNDTYYIQNTGDVVTELTGEGTDTIYASVSYTLTTGSEIETLRANAGSTGLTLTGNEFNNTIVGGAGNDVINGGGGSDAMSGSTGNDVYYVDNVGDTVTEAAGEGTDDRVYTSVDFTLAAGSEIESIWANAGTTGLTLTGNELNNTIIGGSGNDTINGGGGNDLLMGGAGADAMAGGTGNDAYYVDDIGDTATEAASEGTDDRVYTSADFTLAAGSEIESIWANAGSTGLTLTGNELNNTIIGGAGDDTINGGGGNDVLMGGIGADAMTGGTGNDVYYVDNVGDTVTELTGEGTDDRVYTSADFTLAAGSEIESIWANAGSTGLTLTGNELNNTIVGGAGNDTINGGGGADLLFAGAGADAMAGGTGNDAYYVDNVGDTVTEFTGEGTDDRVYTSADFTLAAGSEIESIWANAGSTGLTLTGNELNNTIVGGAGNDTINGGGGADALYGGAGADSFVFQFGNGSGAGVTDFASSTDHLDFFGYGTAGTGATLVQIGASDYYEITPDAAHGGAAAAETVQIVNVFSLTNSDYLFH